MSTSENPVNQKVLDYSKTSSNFKSYLYEYESNKDNGSSFGSITKFRI